MSYWLRRPGRCSPDWSGRQDLRHPLSIITVLMPLALFGILGLAAVVLVHEFTEVIVIANGVRAGRIKPLAGPPKTPDRTIPG